VFNLWGSFTIPANGQAVLTQTSQYNFDTSDFPIEPCGTTVPSTDPRVPTVAITTATGTVTVSDSGHVLDTGGFDLACRGNESTQWTQIGSVPCAGATLTLAPPSQTHAVGDTATMTATFANGCGDPLSGAQVTFGDLSGPNAGLTSPPTTTNSSGQATFSYSSAKAGQDVWQAFVQNPAGTIGSNGIVVNWSVLMTGRAYGLSASVLGVNVAPIPDTGPVSTTSSGIVAPPCVATVTVPGPLAVARTLCAAVQTDASTKGSLALADVADTFITIPGLPNVLALAVHSASGTNCAGSKGITTIGYLKVGSTVLINTANNPAPNTTIPLGIGKLVLNEQTPVSGGLMVNAIHLIVPGIANVVIASTTSDMHGCP
jgi:hypothetical protein